MPATEPVKLPWWQQALIGLALTPMFAIALVAGALIHLEVPAARRAAATVVNAVLASQLAGVVRVAGIERLAAGRIVVADVTIDDPQGHRVLTAKRAEIAGPGWLGLAVLLGNAPTFVVPAISIGEAELALAIDPTGQLGIARAVAPKPGPPGPPSPPSPPTLTLWLQRLTIGKLRVTGGLGADANARLIDAELTGFEGSLVSGVRDIRFDIDRLALGERGLLGAPLTAKLNLSLVAHRIPGDVPVQRVDVASDLEATIGKLILRARARQRDGRLRIEVDAPRVGVEEIAPWAARSGFEPRAPLAAAVQIEGAPPLFDVKARVDLPPASLRSDQGGGIGGAVELRGHVQLGLLPLVTIDLGWNDVDVALVGAKLPASRAAGWTRVRGRVAGSSSEITATFASKATEIALDGGPAITIPPIEGNVSASLAGVDCRVRIAEPGSPSDALVRIGADRAVEFAVRTLVPALASVDRLQRYLPLGLRGIEGKGEVVLAGRLGGGGEVDAGVRADLTALRLGEARVSAGRAHVEARVHGPKSQLSLEARAAGHGVSVGDNALGRVSLAARGPLAEPHLEAEIVDPRERKLSARGVISPKRRELRRLELTISRADTELLKGSAGSVSLAGDGKGAVEISGIELGKDVSREPISGRLRIARGEIEGKLAGKGLRLDVISKLLGMTQRLSGSADVDLDLRTGASVGERFGHARLKLSDAGYLIISGIDGELGVDFDGKKARPKLAVSWHGQQVGSSDPCAKVFAALAAHGDLELDGALLQRETWRDWLGTLALDGSEVDLGCVAKVIRIARKLPLETIEGTANLSFALARARGERLPSIKNVVLDTDALRLAPHSVDGNWKSDRLDLHLEGKLDANSGRTELDVRLHDSDKAHKTKPRVARATIKTDIDVAALIDPPPRAVLLLKAANTPFEATIDIDGLDAARRAALPHPLAEALAPYDGVVSLDAYASGTILDPTGSARLRIARLTPKVTEAGLPYPSVDLDVLARYRDGVGRIDGWIDALDTAADGEQRPRSVASFDAEIRPPKPRLFGPPLGPRLTANARLDRLPLGAIPQLALRQVAGTVSGKLSVADLGGDPRISLRLDGDGLSLGRDLELSRARVELAPTGSYDPSQVTGLVDLSVRGGGRLSARGYGSLAWTDGVRPRPGADRPAAVYAKADAFPLRALLPFIPEGITNLEGQLDGGLHLAYKEVLGRDVQLSMDLALTGGRLEMPNFGQELENVSMRLSAQPGKVLVQNIDAHTPGGGHITGQFDARMTDLSVTDITGKLTVADGEQIPVALVGQPIGSVAGQVSLQARRSFVGEESQLDIVVTAADLKLDLPANIGPGGGRQEPQKLEDHSDVSVSLPIAAPAVQARTGSGRINLTMALKDAVVEGRPIKIRVSTDPEKPIRATDARELSGELVFAGGELRLLGKTFEIDRGLVRLRAEEPGNPYVSVTAHWNAPDGTLVFVDYLGVVRPIDRDKLKFRSNPPKSEDALLSLLVLGDAGDSTAGLADAQSRANQAIRGVLANEINRMFSDVTPGLSAGVAATSQGYTATTLNYQINDRLTAQAIYEQAPGTGVLGTNAPTAGTTTSTTSTTGGTAAEARTKIGLDWRFAKNFLLRGYVGLTGGADNGVDLLYQYRY